LGSGKELRSRRAVKLQRIREQFCRLAIGMNSGSAFQITYRAGTDTRAIGKRLLGQITTAAMLPKKIPEEGWFTGGRVGRHSYTALSPRQMEA
jgi:hypothetical protein